MSEISLELFKSVVKINQDKYYFVEIILGSAQKVEIVIMSKSNKFDCSTITISNVQICKLLETNSLPDELEKLTLENVFFNNSGKINIINNLPEKLKKLKLVDIKSNLENLPLSLEVLELVGNCSECCLDYLPSGLKTLLIQSNYKGNLDNLPPTLENLLLLSEYTNNLTNLPSGLKFLLLNSHANINIKLPKNIQCVNYPEDNNSLRRKFLKLYPKVIYNDKFYQEQIETYDKTFNVDYCANLEDDDSSYNSNSDSDNSDSDYESDNSV